MGITGQGVRGVDRSTDLVSGCFGFSSTWYRSLLLSFSTCYLGILGLEGAINCILARTSHQRTTSEKRTKALLPKCPLFGASTVVNIGGSFEMFRDHVSWYKFVQLGIQLSDQWLFGDPFLNVDSNPFCLNCSLNPLVFSLFL